MWNQVARSQFVCFSASDLRPSRSLSRFADGIPGRNATWARAADGCRDETRPGRGRRTDAGTKRDLGEGGGRMPGRNATWTGKEAPNARASTEGDEGATAPGDAEGPPRGCGTALRTAADYSARRRRAAMPPSTSMNVPVVEPEAGETR